MRAFLFGLFAAVTLAAAPKGKTAKAKPGKAPSSPPTSPPSAVAQTESPTVSPTFNLNTTQNATLVNGSEVILVDLKAIANNLFKLTEASKFEQASALFASGMAYVTNGQQYELDLSIPADVKSIPMRYRTQLVWTYDDNDEYELWGHCIVTYAADNSTEPEFILLHFNKEGLIDLFSHIQPKAAQCTAIETPVQASPPAQGVMKLALLKTNGEIVDAPQAELQAMYAQQHAATNNTDNSTNVPVPSSNATKA